MLNRLTDSLDFHGQALGLRSERQRLLASNIANADTPGYVARDMNFAQALRNAVSTGSGTAGSPRTQAEATQRPGDLQLTPGVRDSGELLYAAASQTNMDSNSVDMDRERASFADNSVKYEATLRFINGHVRTMLDAIKGQ